MQTAIVCEHVSTYVGLNSAILHSITIEVLVAFRAVQEWRVLAEKRQLVLMVSCPRVDLQKQTFNNTRVRNKACLIRKREAISVRFNELNFDFEKTNITNKLHTHFLERRRHQQFQLGCYLLFFFISLFPCGYHLVTRNTNVGGSQLVPTVCPSTTCAVHNAITLQTLSAYPHTHITMIRRPVQ